jgi:hypothetical protein
MRNLFKRKNLSDYNPNLSRPELIRRSRILMIDDDQPKLIEDLKADGFSVDYDPTGNDTAKIEKGLYDLIILDFGGVGAKFGITARARGANQRHAVAAPVGEIIEQDAAGIVARRHRKPDFAGAGVIQWYLISDFVRHDLFLAAS